MGQTPARNGLIGAHTARPQVTNRHRQETPRVVNLVIPSFPEPSTGRSGQRYANTKRAHDPTTRHQAPTRQCWTSSSGIGRSEMLAVASAAPTPTAAAAIKQSAWCSVMPLSAKSRRQRPARWPSAAPNGATRSACTRRRATGSSSGLRPRQISSTDTADTHGSTPARRKLRRRSAAGRPRSASISTVESSSNRDTLSPTGADRPAAGRGPSRPRRRPNRGRCRRSSRATIRSRPSDARHRGRAGSLPR